MNDILDVHTHTLASGHAYNTIKEMALEASEKGIELLGITEHAPTMPGTCHEFYFQNLHVVPREMFGVQLLLGSEVNILDHEGTLDLSDQVLKKLDICIASIHPPCYKKATKRENTNAIVGAMENPYINVIGHPDDGRYELDYETIVKKAKEYGVLLELNNSSVAPGSFRPNSRENDLTMLKYCKQYEVPVIMSSDAHTAYDIGNHVYVKDIIKEAMFPEDLVVNHSKKMLLQMIENRRKSIL
ncbi:phosphatase [Lachnoclostridium sp.]|uniref:phosphatase n=1 Tax=Lachnoclostridium sp. TaxID=2028282 RepID=UPI00289F2635|nr:phosphatase [Lachnoclostridium sp.]